MKYCIKDDFYVMISKKDVGDIDIIKFFSQSHAADRIDPDKAAQALMQYRTLRMRYSCALKEIRTKFEVLSTEFGSYYDRNPIVSVTTRLKSTPGIIEKMQRKGITPSFENMKNEINDIAGVRVICSYIDDIYLLAELFRRQHDITLIEEKDYIKNPKPNGYRSLHLIVSVPVFFAEHTAQMKVEVQIRTIAMDFWASLEHEIKYKKNLKNPEMFTERLRSCAETIAQTDAEMQNIRSLMEEMTESDGEDLSELLLGNVDDIE